MITYPLMINPSVSKKGSYFVIVVTPKTQYIVYYSVIFQKNDHILWSAIYNQDNTLYNKDSRCTIFFFFHLMNLVVSWLHLTYGCDQGATGRLKNLGMRHPKRKAGD